MKKNNKKEVLATSAPMYKFDAATGFWGIPNIQRDTDFDVKNGRVVRLCYNSHGNRDKDFSYVKGQRNFLCCGGSHTWGAYVTDEERYSNILKQKTGLNFMNIGHPSLGLDQIAIAITEKTLVYHPEGIIIEQYPWAFHRVLSSFVNGYIKPYFYLDSEGNLKLQKLGSLAKYKMYRDIVCAYRIIKKEIAELKNDIDIKSAYDPLTDPVFLLWKRKYYDYGYKLFASIARYISDYCAQNNIKFLLFLTAHQQQFVGSSKSQLIDYDLPLKLLRSALLDQNVPFTEFTQPLLRSHSKIDPVIMPDGHLNAHGHAVIAQEVEKDLVKRGWF